MLVDDDPGVLRLIEIVIKRAGFKVTSTTDGQTALEMLDSDTPDLFVLDVMMPGMDGIELCQRLRSMSQTRERPIVILSAKSDKASIQKGLDAGANVYIAKTDMSKLLVPQIQDLLQQSAASA
jgi:DNA-binding response OmpR family regulator